MGTVLVVVLLALAGAGCGGKKKPAAAPPSTGGSGSPAATSSSGAPSATPSASTPSVIEFSVDGAGPYQLDATLAALKAAAALDEVTTGAPPCPDTTSARGTGVWRDVRLSFRKDGTLYLAVNKSPSIPTPSGAWLGTPLAQLKTIYAGISGEDIAQGTRSAYLVVTLSGRGILFDLDAGKRVSAMTAGEAAYLKTNYVGGTNYC